MQKHLYTVMVAIFVIFLTGCQSDATLPAFFNYNPAPRMDLGQAVQSALMRSGDPAVSQVQVESNQNQVRLSGYVKKIRQSDFAEQIARQVPGVQSVENRIIVRP